jgi:hypothetical protein
MTKQSKDNRRRTSGAKKQLKKRGELSMRDAEKVTGGAAPPPGINSPKFSV